MVWTRTKIVYHQYTAKKKSGGYRLFFLLITDSLATTTVFPSILNRINKNTKMFQFFLLKNLLDIAFTNMQLTLQF